MSTRRVGRHTTATPTAHDRTLTVVDTPAAQQLATMTPAGTTGEGSPNTSSGPLKRTMISVAGCRRRPVMVGASVPAASVVLAAAGMFAVSSVFAAAVERAAVIPPLGPIRP